MKKVSAFLIALLSLFTQGDFVNSQHYDPTWASLDTRPLPPWYDEAKIGIFLHWGVFSVPSYMSEWFWEYWRTGNINAKEFMAKNYRPGFTYADFAPQFSAQFYDTQRWAEIFKESGARYVVLTTKHHEGFTNWPSKNSFNWNAMDVGPKKDLVALFVEALRAFTDLRVGLYHSLFEWFNPLFLEDEANNFTTQYFVWNKTMPELYDLVNTYKPDLIWSDGDWMANHTYWNSTNFLAWLFNDSPVKNSVVVNDRWGKYTRCKHGSFFNCDDKFNPGKLFPHKWENAMSIDKSSWGYRRDLKLDDLNTIEELLQLLAETISCGGNLLINVGPTKEGIIVPIFEERLKQLGSWLKVNGEAIYASKPWSKQNDTITPGVWYTAKNSTSGTSVYAILLKWPGKSLILGSPITSSVTTVNLLGYPEFFNWEADPSGGMKIEIPPISYNEMPCQWAWVLKLQGLKNQFVPYPEITIN
ncbi:hypothetical protein ScPMuIL_003702 [Solemya velum]